MRFITSSSVVKSCCQIDWRKKDNVWVGFFRLWHLASDHLIRRCSIQNTRDTKHRKNCRVERSEWWIMNEWVSYPCRYRAARAAQTFQAQKIHFKHKKICFVRLWQVVSDDLIRRCPIQHTSIRHWCQPSTDQTEERQKDQQIRDTLGRPLAKTATNKTKANQSDQKALHGVFVSQMKVGIFRLVSCPIMPPLIIENPPCYNFHPHLHKLPYCFAFSCLRSRSSGMHLSSGAELFVFWSMNKYQLRRQHDCTLKLIFSSSPILAALAPPSLPLFMTP